MRTHLVYADEPTDHAATDAKRIFLELFRSENNLFARQNVGSSAYGRMLFSIWVMANKSSLFPAKPVTPDPPLIAQGVPKMKISNFVKHVSMPDPGSVAASSPSALGIPGKISRSNDVRNLGLPAPIGKREQIKQFLGTTFSVNAKPVAYDAPVAGHFKRAASKPTTLSQATAPQQSTKLQSAKPDALLLARFNAVSGASDTLTSARLDASQLARFNAVPGLPKTARANPQPNPNREYPTHPMLKKSLPTIREVDGEDDHG